MRRKECKEYKECKECKTIAMHAMWSTNGIVFWYAVGSADNYFNYR